MAASRLLLALLIVVAAACYSVQAESDPASIGFSSDHAALSTYAAAASVRAGQMASEFSKLAEQSIADGEAHAEKERKIRKAEADYAKKIADTKAREVAKRAERAARAARIAATRTRTFALSFDAPIATFTAEARTAIIADVATLMGVDAGRVSIVKIVPTRSDAEKTRIRFKVLAASAFKAPSAAAAAKPKVVKAKKDAKPTFTAPKPGKLGRRKGQQKLGVFVKPAGAAAAAAAAPKPAQTPLAKSTKRALQSLAAALKSGAKADALKTNKVNAASLNQQTKAERAATRAAKAAARVARRAALKKSLLEFAITRKNAKIALLAQLKTAKKSKADTAAAIKAFNQETRSLRRALRRSLRGDRKRDPILRGLLQAFRSKAKDARRTLRASLAARPAKERKQKLRELRQSQAQQRKEIIARFRRERKVARKQARKAVQAEMKKTAVAASAAAAPAAAAPKSSFMELLSAQESLSAIPDWPSHSRRGNVGEKVRVLASGKPRQYAQRDASQAKYIRLLPKHTAAESYAEHFQSWAKPKPAVSRKTVAQIKRKKFLGAAKKKPAAAAKAKVVAAPKLAKLPQQTTTVPIPQSLVPVAAAKTASKSTVPQSARVDTKKASWWTPWHICIVVMSGIAFLGITAGLAVWMRKNKSDRAAQELYAAV